jgi:hypothetical protein
MEAPFGTTTTNPLRGAAQRFLAAIRGSRSWTVALWCALASLVSLPAQAQITFVGGSAQVVSASAGSISPAIPAGTMADDFAVLIVAGRPSDESEPAAPTGWTLRSSVYREVSSTDLKIMTFYRLLTGGDANPVVTLPAAWVGSPAGMSGQIAVWRGVNTTTPFDVTDTTGQSNPNPTDWFVPPAITTVSAGAWVVAAAATSDDNDVRFLSAVGFTARMSGTSYDTTVGDDHSVALADITQSTAGVVGMPTWNENTNAPDRWVAITFALRPPGAGAKFTITHNAFGIHCVAETITVDVVDVSAGTPLLNYNAQVQLDTQSGNGTWALVTGSGTFNDGTAGDGVATYAWPLGQSQATFTLHYPQGPPSIDVDVFQITDTGVRDDDAEGALVFSPNGFTVTAAALTNPVGAVTPFATNQIAGTSFTLQLAAFGQTATDPVCGIIEGYAGTKNLKFWSEYVDPGTGTRNVTIDGVSAAATEGASTAQAITFANGQAAVTAKYKDVGRIRILMKDDTTVNAELPAGIAGATTNFVVRPYDFALSSIANAAGSVVNPQAADASGAVFLAAGAPFRATVTVRDAEGSATPNYGRESIPETVRLTTQLVAPAGGASPAIGWTTGFGSFTNGVATGTDFIWSEVGIVRAVPGVGDGNYLTAGIGRFVPSHFVVALNSPLFATACSAGGFTYQGQSFGYATAPVITATAVAASGSTTTNYTGSFFKLTNTTLSGRSYSSPAAALDTSGLPATAVDPAIATPSGGVATLTFSSGTGLAFGKGAPQAPFAAQLQLSLDVEDSDGVAAVGAAPLGNPVTFGSAGGMQFTAGQQIRYGRVRVGTAVGSELIDLAVSMRAEYYFDDGTGFVANAQDTCTTSVSLAFPAYTENLSAGETCVRDSGAPGASALGCAAAALTPYREPPLGGDFNLQLAAPGAGNQGSVLIRAAVPAWLRFDWDAGGAGDEDPTGQATFGIYGGERRLIYTREIY